MADSEENGWKKGEFGVEKWSLRPDLVDGCSRSGDRVVELLVRKTVVSVSKKSEKSRVILEIKDYA